MNRKQSSSADRIVAALKWIAVASVFATSAWLTACNTTEGAGKDVKDLGQGIEDAAKDAKN